MQKLLELEETVLILKLRAIQSSIIAPNVNFNSIKGDWNYEDFFFTEFVPYVEKQYRVKADKRFRAISGLSMGGGGIFMYALHHPDKNRNVLVGKRCSDGGINRKENYNNKSQR